MYYHIELAISTTDNQISLNSILFFLSSFFFLTKKNLFYLMLFLKILIFFKLKHKCLNKINLKKCLVNLIKLTNFFVDFELLRLEINIGISIRNLSTLVKVNQLWKTK